MRQAIVNVLIFLLAPSAKILAQGCSDAGFCSLGGFKTDGLTRSFVLSPELVFQF